MRLFSLASVATILLCGTGQAQERLLNKAELFENPPELAPAVPTQMLGARVLASQVGGSPQAEATYDLNVAFTQNATIDNPSTGTPDKVRLRAYNGTLTAPTLAAVPGQTVRLRLHNNLPVASTDVVGFWELGRRAELRT